MDFSAGVVKTKNGYDFIAHHINGKYNTKYFVHAKNIDTNDVTITEGFQTNISTVNCAITTDRRNWIPAFMLFFAAQAAHHGCTRDELEEDIEAIRGIIQDAEKKFNVILNYYGAS